MVGRPLYEGVDWNSCLKQTSKCNWSRPLYEGVDWNAAFAEGGDTAQDVALFTRAWIEIIRPKQSYWVSNCVALFTRAWIEILVLSYNNNDVAGRPLYEGVDWNDEYRKVFQKDVVALFTRAWIEISSVSKAVSLCLVALFTRAWIEIWKESVSFI